VSRSWPLLLCRGSTAVLAVLVALQPVLAGGFLSGHYDLLRMHMLTGVSMIAVALVQAVLVVLLHRSGGPRAVLIAGLLLPVLLAAEGVLGSNRVLALHVPLGVGFVFGLFRLAALVWRPVPAPAEVPAEVLS
jgi:hypothetical protein